jgi:hypothetical protein
MKLHRGGFLDADFSGSIICPFKVIRLRRYSKKFDKFRGFFIERLLNNQSINVFRC